METHPDPSKALSDGPNAWPLHQMKELLTMLKEIDQLIKSPVKIEGDTKMMSPFSSTRS